MKERGSERQLDAGVEARAQELAEGMLELGSKVERAEQFLASAGHELKTPLANLRGELQLALMMPRSPADYRDFIASGLTHTERLIALTNDLLMFAKVSYSPAQREPESCELCAIVLDALEIAVQERDLGNRVSIEIPDDLSISGRPEELIRLFRNLLDNAIEHAPAESKVTVRSELKGDAIYTCVEDEGPALDPNESELLFLPFHRGTNEGSGFGLGLSIARAIARGHGGDLLLDTNAQHPRFMVRLPVAVPS